MLVFVEAALEPIYISFVVQVFIVLTLLWCGLYPI